MATITRPTAGYTPTNPITNTTKYQVDSAATSPRVAISSVKVDGDINKAFDTLTDHDDRIEDLEASAFTDGDKGDITVSSSGTVWTVDNSAISTAKIANDAVTFAKMQNITTARLLGRTTASSGDVEEISVGTGLTLSGGSLTPVTATTSVAGIRQLRVGEVIQTVYAKNSTLTSVTGVVPQDNTIPQSSETGLVVAAAITPTSATSLLLITAFATGSTAAQVGIQPFLFQDPSADAIACGNGMNSVNNGANNVFACSVGTSVVAGGTSSINFSLKVGTFASTNIYVNGTSAGGAIFGGTMTSWIKIEEIRQ